MATTKRQQTKRDVAADVWRMMAGFTTDRLQQGEHFRILRSLGLTPGHLKALAALDPSEPRPMRALADTLMCDASMVTWLVDRLEERGLVERRTMPADRRVKTLILTKRGIEVRRQLAEALHEPPEALTSMDARSLGALQAALQRLPEPTGVFWVGMAPPDRD